VRRVIGPLALACLLVSLNSCDLLFPTRLTIHNYTSFDLDFVEWNGHYFGNDMVWDQVNLNYEQGIAAGHSDTIDVESATDYVSFWFTSPGPQMATVELVTVSRGEQKTFALYDATSVITLSVAGGPAAVLGTAPTGESGQTRGTVIPRR
jgi:hypothetical protein